MLRFRCAKVLALDTRTESRFLQRDPGSLRPSPTPMDDCHLHQGCYILRAHRAFRLVFLIQAAIRLHCVAKTKGLASVIVFIIGTSAEAIKIQPVLRRLRDQKIPFEIWSTYQHTEALDKALDSLALPGPSYAFARGDNGKPIERPGQMFSWIVSCFKSLFRDRKALGQRLGESPLVIVHGDTVTTVFGAIAARILGAPCAHIEAGLRSGKLTKPFPEEIDRRIVGKLAAIHFAPNAEAAGHLGKRDVVNTYNNTAVDGVLDVLGTVPSEFAAPYGLVLLHRYEFIAQPSLVRETISTLAEKSPVPLVVITDVFSGGAIRNALEQVSADRVRIVDKLSYPKFVNAMSGAEFVFTDSGGLQEEAGLLGVPTMLHREVTERPDGIGRNIILSYWNLDKVASFVLDYAKFRRPMIIPENRPSDIIVETLRTRGFSPTNHTV